MLESGCDEVNETESDCGEVEWELVQTSGMVRNLLSSFWLMAECGV